MKSRFLRSTIAILTAAALLLPCVFASPAGEQVWQTVTNVASGVTYTNTVSTHPSYGREELYTVSLNPGGQVRPIVLTGDSTVYYGGTLSEVISRARVEGYRVLGAVNSDFFATSTRVPMGIVIENGIYKSSPEGENAIGFRADGTAFLSHPQVTITLTNNGGSPTAANAGQSITISHLNKNRNEAGLYLFNQYYSTVSTRTATPGWMVVMKAVEGSDELRVNSTLTLVVEDVFLTDEVTHPHATPLSAGTYVLTAAASAGQEEVFSRFAPGDVITLTTNSTDPVLFEAQWACGAGDILVQNGMITDSGTWDSAIATARHPRTLMGIRADGAIQLTVGDGRKASHSNGLTLQMAAEELLSQGCVSVVNLDGGGSSAMAVQLPGSDVTTVVNSPSDGSLRRCGSYILFVSTEPPAGTAQTLHLAKNGAVVLSGGTLDLNTFYASDATAYNTAVPNDVTVSVAGTCGTLAGTQYYAASPGIETVTLYSPSTNASGTGQIYVTGSLSSMSVTRSDESGEVSSLSLESGESVQLNLSGQWNGLPVTLSNHLATWAVTGGIGSISPDGLFTAGAISGASGEIQVTCGGQTKSISLTMPISFLDISENWAKSFIQSMAERGIVGGVNTDAGTMFYPDRNLTRQEFFVMLSNILGVHAADYAGVELPFADTAEIPEWSANYIKAMYALGYSGGSLEDDGKLYSNFDHQITRAEIAAMLSQFLTLPENFDAISFADQDQIPEWALPGILNTVANGLMAGYPDNTIKAGNNATRAEACVILYNFIPKLASSGIPTPPVPGQGTTDPGTSDPGAADPGVTDPNNPGPGQPWTGTTDPAGTGTGTADPNVPSGGSTDPNYPGPGQPWTGTTDPAGTGTGSTDPNNPGPGQPWTGTTDPAGTGTGAADPNVPSGGTDPNYPGPGQPWTTQ